MRFALAALLLAASGAEAQVRPQPSTGDPHIQSVEFQPDQVVALQSAPGYQVTVEFAPDEHIENVAVGDSAGWQVAANRRGDRLFVKPVQQGASTNMIVVTDARLYSFELSTLPGPQPDMAYSVRFRYPPPAAPESATADTPVGRYKLAGAAALRPSGMHDDGVHTYIEWPEERALPAIYAINDQGKESLVNGMMRDGRMVVDSIHAKFVFRIDNHSATARRVAASAR